MNAAEIAKITGVSRSTVTRVINNYSDISEETKKKVMDAVEKYGYAPNSSARSLVGKKPKEIGFFLFSGAISSSVYYGELITKLVDYAEEQGYSVLTSLIKREQYGKITRFLNTESIQGAILVGGRTDEKEVLELIKGRHKVIVYDKIKIDTELYNYSGIVNPDNVKGAYMATEYLIKKGHRKIMHITGYLNKLPGIERLEGYKKALTDYGIEIDDELIITIDTENDKTPLDLLDEYLEKHKLPSAIFAVTDVTAIEVMRFLKGKGYKIPDDVSIVGFDDIYLSKEVDPSLTTIRVDLKEFAKETVEKLIQLIESEEAITSRTILDVKLIERDSVKEFLI